MNRTHLTRIIAQVLADGDPARKARAEGREIRSLRTVRTRVEGRPLYLQAQVRATTINGWYTVTLRPWGPHSYQWTCTCQDSAMRGMQVGPCKHTIAVAVEATARLTGPCLSI